MIPVSNPHVAQASGLEAGEILLHSSQPFHMGGDLRATFRMLKADSHMCRFEVVWSPAPPDGIEGQLERRYQAARAVFLEEVATLAGEPIQLLHLHYDGSNTLRTYEPQTKQ